MPSNTPNSLNLLLHLLPDYIARTHNQTSLARHTPKAWLWQAPILNSDIVCYFWNYINNANYRHYDQGKLWLDVLPKILTPSLIFLKYMGIHSKRQVWTIISKTRSWPARLWESFTTIKDWFAKCILLFSGAFCFWCIQTLKKKRKKTLPFL